MAKRRTKKDKKKAKHAFTIKWDSGSTRLNFEPDVKGQIPEIKNEIKPKAHDIRHAEFSASNVNLATIKKDITKSLILASLILASEVVLYLVWR